MAASYHQPLLDFEVHQHPENVDQILHEIVQKKIHQAKESFVSMFNSLEPLQAALMKTMAMRRSQFAPFTQETYDLCRAFCSERTKEKVKIDSSAVGYALDLLRKNSLVWKSGRGVYSIEDTQHISWLSGIPEEGLDTFQRGELDAKIIPKPVV